LSSRWRITWGLLGNSTNGNKFGVNIVDEAELSREIYQLLNYGKRALGFSRQIDEITRKTIANLIVEAKKANGELTFFLGAFLEFLRMFGNS